MCVLYLYCECKSLIESALPDFQFVLTLLLYTFVISSLQSSPRYHPTTPGLHISTSLNNTLNTTLNTSTHTAVTHHTHSTAHMNTHNSHTPPVEYITQPTADLDLRALDFSSTRSLRVLGFTLAQMRDSKCFDLKELLGAGFPLNEVKNLKSTLYVNITAKDLRLAGYSAHEVSICYMLYMYVLVYVLVCSRRRSV